MPESPLEIQALISACMVSDVSSCSGFLCSMKCPSCPCPPLCSFFSVWPTWCDFFASTCFLAVFEYPRRRWGRTLLGEELDSWGEWLGRAFFKKYSFFFFFWPKVWSNFISSAGKLQHNSSPPQTWADGAFCEIPEHIFRDFSLIF